MTKERFKVLLVDDEKEFVESLSERLQLRNLDADIAYNGEEALEALAHGEHNVMVLDLRMPGIDGMEVLRRVRQTNPDMRVVILTGHGTDRDEAEALKLGAFEYMQKPVDIDKLDSTLHRAWQSFKDAVDYVDHAWMAAAYSTAGQQDMAREIMDELKKDKDRKDHQKYVSDAETDENPKT